MKLFFTFLALLMAPLLALRAADRPRVDPVKVLFFSKASSWEQAIIHRDSGELSFIEKAMQKLGQENQIEFTFTKDGTFFTAENLAQFKACFFYTSGDLTSQPRTGRGDNYPLMTLPGKTVFLDAIENGMGFVGCNTANYTFTERLSPGEKDDATNAWRFTRMIGAGYMGHNEVQAGSFSYLDRAFPGMEKIPTDYRPVDQWYAFNRLMPDLHVIMALQARQLAGNLYERADYPVAWARMQGRGRVFYTTMGHTTAIWEDPIFLQMLLGGIRWTAKSVDARVDPNLAEITPEANVIPLSASKFLANHPTVVDPHFPNFKVWLDKDYPVEAGKHVLVFSKSAGQEPPVAYRDTAWPSHQEKELLEFGQAHHIDFTFSKDGTIFTAENLAAYDAVLLCTSGDPVNQPRNGRGDNYPLMTPSGKQALLQAIRDGKGLIGVHSALDLTRGEAGSDTSALAACATILGATYNGESPAQRGSLLAVDRAFPGMETMTDGFTPIQEWYQFKNLQPDLHVILELDAAKMTGDQLRAPSRPVAWARMAGKGRVYYTSLGQDAETWKSPAFQNMLLGAIRWATRSVDVKVAPNLPAQ